MSRSTVIGRGLATTLLFVLITATASRAQEMRDLVAAALDQEITQRIEIDEQPIRAALTGLEQRTGLRFELADQAVEWMPYGAATEIGIVLQDVSVRQALRRIFDGLGLQMRIVGDRVRIEPAPLLERMGRRLTIEEVRALQEMTTHAWAELEDDGRVTVGRLPGSVPTRSSLVRALRDADASSALVAADVVARDHNAFWLLNGAQVDFYDKAERVKERLQRPIDVHYRRIPLDALLLDLGRRVGVTVQFEPGVLERVNADQREVDLIQRDISTQQVLELIVGRTGLWYDITEDALVIGAGTPTDLANPTARDAQRPRVAAILRVPVGDDGTTIDFLIREDELPPEFIALRDQKMPAVIEMLREKLAPSED